MKDLKKSQLKDLKKDLNAEDKLEQLVIDFAIRKTSGSREDLDGVFYSKNGRHVLMASKSLKGSYTVCEGTRDIDSDAFWGCAYLEEITLPEGIETIGHEAFGRCISLREIKIPSTVVKLGTNPFIEIVDLKVESSSDYVVSDGKAVFADGGKTLVSYISSDQEYKIPKGVETIGEKAFSKNKYIKAVALPSSLKVIDDEAFFDCDSLIGITLPSGIDQIGACAFADCASLKKVEFSGVPAKYKRSMLSGCDNLNVILVPDGSIEKFGKLTRDFDDRVVEKKRKAPMYKK